MNFTKQDLQKISAYLGRQSVKDSQFSKVQSLKSDTGIPVLQSGENKMTTIEQLLSYLHTNMSLAEIPIEIMGLNEHNLLGILGEIYALAKTKVTVGGNGLSADNITYPRVIDGVQYTQLSYSLNYIFSVLNGTTPFPASATEQDINNIFN